MAEVADFHIALDGFEDEEDEIETVGSIAYWPYEFEHEEICSSESDSGRDPDPFSPRFEDEFIPSDLLTHYDSFGSDSDSVTELNDFIRQDHREEVNPILVSDVFDRCIEHEEEEEEENRNLNTPFDQDPFFRVDDENNEIGSSNYLDLGLGLGRIDEEEGDIEDGGFMIDDDYDDDDVCCGEFFVGRRCESGGSSEIRDESGLRVVEIGLDSDEEVDNEIIGEDLLGNEDGLGEVQDELDTPICWDCLRLDDHPSEANDIHEWEEVVTNRFEERDELSVMMDFEERSVSASLEILEVLEGREESMQNSEWGFLLPVSNLEPNGEEEDSEDDFDPDDHISPEQYEILFGQLAENENAGRGSPPTSKRILENLPSIVLTQDDINNKGALCAVCKDEISTEEQAKLLPCSHYYHGDCILPWLNIRNTCPVCRFELATDDPEYEQRRIQRAGRGSSEASQVRYNFQMFPED